MNLCASSTFRILLGSLFILLSSPVWAQGKDTLLQKKIRVRTFEIEGNKKTKTRIITREMTMHADDSLTLAQLAAACKRTQQNLMNTSLFVHDTVNYTLDSTGNEAVIRIKLQERWYVWPGLIFEIQDRNFNSWWEHKDLFRINYGVSLTVYNLFGLNQTLSMIFRRGYTEQYGASYRIPYLDKKQTLGLTASFNYFRNNEVWYRTYYNELEYYRDYKNYIRREQEAKVGLTHRHKLYIRQSLEAYYKHSSINDSVVSRNSNYFAPGQKNLEYFSLQYRFTYDYRDYKPYPTKGILADFIGIKDGVGLLRNETTNNLSLFASVKVYTKLFYRTYFMGAVKGRYMPLYQPMYFFNRALGFNDLVRGYEYYVVDGQNYSLFRGNIRFQLIKPHVIHLPIRSFKKFNHIMYAMYTGPFADAGYVQDSYFGKNNALANNWQTGIGWGLDIIAYYDLVLRVEATVNRMQQTGIYLHLNAPL